MLHHRISRGIPAFIKYIQALLGMVCRLVDIEVLPHVFRIIYPLCLQFVLSSSEVTVR